MPAGQIPQLPPIKTVPSPPTLPTGDTDPSEETPSPADSGSHKRIRTTAGPASRGVAALTPEQLAKKRANDREAQRAIRERTKKQISNLERQIRDLTNQKPYQELQLVVKEKEAVEAENADIRKRLEQVIALVQPILSHHGTIRPSITPPSQQQYAPARPNSGSQFNVSTPTSSASPGAAQWHPQAIRVTDPESRYPSKQPNVEQQAQQRIELANNLDPGPEKLGVDFLLDSSKIADKGNTHTNGQGSRYQSPAPGWVHPRNHLPNPLHINASRFPPDLPFFAIPIQNCPATSPLDTILLDFLHERQSLLATASPEHVLGPAYPSVSGLLHRAMAPNPHPLSRVFIDILSTFPDLDSLPEKVATLYVMFLLMRWAIVPTAENYDRLPEWMRPRVSQVTTSHPIWLDFLPWPAMRDRLVREYNPRRLDVFDDFFIPYTTTVSVNWKYEDSDCLIRSDGREGEVSINPVFERHLFRLENWSLGPAFEQAFPWLDGLYRVEKYGRSGSGGKV